MTRLCLLFLGYALAFADQEMPVAKKKARQAPAFLEHATIYQIWMRSFTPEGTLRAATAKLPYIADLGVTIVYLSPIQRQSTDTRVEYWSPRMRQSKAGGSKNPYRIADYDAIDPEYGTEADLRMLVATAHKLNLKVMMDVVFYHAGVDSVLMRRPEFFLHTPEGSITLGPWNFPVLNFANQDLRAYLIRNLVHWAKDLGVDGFRCDVAGRVPLDFWEDARAELDKVNPNIVMLAEADVPEHQLRAFDISYNFPYYTALVSVVRDGEPATRLKEQWEKARAAFPAGARFLHYNDNHDRERADVVFGQKGALATSVLNFTLDGIPFVYNGLEIGDTTPNDIMSHAPIRWDIGTFPAVAPRRELFKRLFQLRREEPALSTAGELLWLKNSRANDVVSFMRRKGDQEVLVAINLSNRKCTVLLDDVGDDAGLFQDLIRQQAVAFPVSDGKLRLDLGAFGFVVAKKAE
jgi:glycosidase